MTMEPNKMEEEFRKKLNSREIQPSEAAWDRLDAMLSVAENKKPKRNFRWLYLAAGLALFLGAGLFLMKQTNDSLTVPVETGDSVVVEDQIDNESANVSEDSNATAPVTFQQQKTTVALAENQPGKAGLVKKEQKSNAGTLPEVSIDKAPVLKETPPVVVENTHQEPEKMLAVNEAPKEQPKVKVNASSLLSSVEGELNLEFRETTLDKIKKNFKTVKTAVAHRNYE